LEINQTIIVIGKTTFGFLEKGVLFQMERGVQHRAFEDLEKKLSSTPILEFFDFTKLFEVHTKASDFAIERVLVQEVHLIFF
jgi:hypothetical protein